jgi:hypothetical protein
VDSVCFFLGYRLGTESSEKILMGRLWPHSREIFQPGLGEVQIPLALDHGRRPYHSGIGQFAVPGQCCQMLWLQGESEERAAGTSISAWSQHSLSPEVSMRMRWSRNMRIRSTSPGQADVSPSRVSPGAAADRTRRGRSSEAGDGRRGKARGSIADGAPKYPDGQARPAMDERVEQRGVTFR